jgi:hypothetical protein
LGRVERQRRAKRLAQRVELGEPPEIEGVELRVVVGRQVIERGARA